MSGMKTSRPLDTSKSKLLTFEASSGGKPNSFSKKQNFLEFV